MGTRLAELRRLPNLLSLLRLVAAGPMYFLLAAPAVDAVPFLFFACAVIATDWLDGLTARRLGLVSDLGKILDPLADKVMLAAVVLGLFVSGRLPWPVLVFLLGKDLLIFLAGLLLVRRTGVVPASNWWGKWATTCLAFGFTLVVLWPVWLPGHVLVITGIALAWATLPSYAVAGLGAAGRRPGRAAVAGAWILTGAAAAAFLWAVYGPLLAAVAAR